MWTLPLLVLSLAIVLAIPLGLAMAAIFDNRVRLPAGLRWLEHRVDTGPQNWKEYALAMLAFNTAAFLIGFAVLALQPVLPLNPDHKGMLAPSLIFHTATSFLTNTNQQHYSGEVHLSYFSQLFFICWKQFITPSIGLCVLLAIVRGLRGDPSMGNFYVDLWRSVAYLFLPLSIVIALLLIAGGVPMTLEGNVLATTVDAGAMGVDEHGAPHPQTIARGPVAAIVAIKQLGTNGGGFFGANCAAPFENPNDWTNVLCCLSIILISIAQIFLFGRMLRNMRHALVIFAVMLVMSLATIAWGIHFDAQRQNEGLTAQAERVFQVADAAAENGRRTITMPFAAGLPVDDSLGNLEGKELRFGTSAGVTWAALTTNTSNGSVNCMHDSLNPLAGLAPLMGLWLNCIWGGIGVGFINFFVYLVIGVFLSGLMVGRTPEYLGKKVEGREMKLAMLALLIHPLLSLGPTGVFAVTDWGLKAQNNPAAHGFTEILYEFSSASANNGSGFEGLADTVGFAADDLPAKAPQRAWDIACGLVMLFSRFIPLIAPLAIAGSLSAKKPTPFTAGTMRTDTFTFGCVLLGTIILVGALLFLPAAVLGPVAEHFGPLPFGG